MASSVSVTILNIILDQAVSSLFPAVIGFAVHIQKNVYFKSREMKNSKKLYSNKVFLLELYNWKEVKIITHRKKHFDKLRY